MGLTGRLGRSCLHARPHVPPAWPLAPPTGRCWDWTGGRREMRVREDLGRARCVPGGQAVWVSPSPRRSAVCWVRELRAVGVLWLLPPHSLWSPGSGPALVKPSAAKALGGRGWDEWGCRGSPRTDGRTDGPTGRKQPELSPGECLPEGRVTVWSSVCSGPGQYRQDGPLDRWTHGHALKGPGWRDVTNPTMRPRAQAPGQCPQTAPTSDPATPSLPAAAQKAALGTSSSVSDRGSNCNDRERRRQELAPSWLLSHEGNRADGRRVTLLSPTEREAQRNGLSCTHTYTGGCKHRDTRAPAAHAWVAVRPRGVCVSLTLPRR